MNAVTKDAVDYSAKLAALDESLIRNMAIAVLRFTIAAHEEELASGGSDVEPQEELRLHIASDKLTLRRLEKEEAKARARFLN